MSRFIVFKYIYPELKLCYLTISTPSAEFWFRVSILAPVYPLKKNCWKVPEKIGINIIARLFEKWWNNAFESEGLCNQTLGHRNAEVCMNYCVILSDINPKVWWFHWLVQQSVEFGWNFIKHVSIYMNNRDVSDNISLDNRLVFSIKPDLLWIRKCSRSRWHQTLWSNMFQVHQISKEIKSLVW